MIQGEFEDVSEDYKAFVDKFKPKKTTDDCYTPPNIYATVLKWAAKHYGFDPKETVRPFWPGKDYRREIYAAECVVVDNPPFSIMAQICRFYHENGVKYFLFAPALTLFNNTKGARFVCCGASVTYENGAVVNTSFVTNLGENLIETAPDLRDLIKAEDDKNRKELVKELPKYAYPDAVVTAAAMNYLSVHHTPFVVKVEDAVFIRKMDAQIGTDKALFGGGFLLTERAAAERAAAHRWELSPREIALQKLIGGTTK